MSNLIPVKKVIAVRSKPMLRSAIRRGDQGNVLFVDTIPANLFCLSVRALVVADPGSYLMKIVVDGRRVSVLVLPKSWSMIAYWRTKQGGFARMDIGTGALKVYNRIVKSVVLTA